MQQPNRIRTTIQPNIIDKLGNGTYYYNFDIQSEVITINNLESNEVIQETVWTYIQVHLSGHPNYKDCVRAVIRKYLESSEEFDLINSYNSSILGILDTFDRQKYMDYLTLVKDIKVKVKKDLSI